MHKTQSGIFPNGSTPPVKAQTIDEFRLLQKRKFAPTPPIQGSKGTFASILDEERHQSQL